MSDTIFFDSQKSGVGGYRRNRRSRNYKMGVVTVSHPRLGICIPLSLQRSKGLGEGVYTFVLFKLVFKIYLFVC